MTRGSTIRLACRTILCAMVPWLVGAAPFQAHTAVPPGNPIAPDWLDPPQRLPAVDPGNYGPPRSQAADPEGDAFSPQAESTEPADALAPSTAGRRREAPDGGEERSPLRYRITWQPAEAVTGQATELGLIEHDLNFTIPVWMADPRMVFFSGGARVDLLATEAVFPQSGRAMPEELWSLRAGIHAMQRFENGWTGGAMLNLDCNSDQPLDVARDLAGRVIAFLRVPHRERNAWNFSLFYAPMSQIDFPVPMLAYHWRPSDALSMNLGLPLQMTWQPAERWTLDVSYMLLTTVHAQATYRLSDSWRVYSAFDWQNQSWFLHDRENDDERLFAYDKRLSVGTQTTVLRHIAVELSSGYLFDRFYFLGEDFDDRRQDRLDLADGLFVSAQSGLMW